MERTLSSESPLKLDSRKWRIFFFLPFLPATRTQNLAASGSNLTRLMRAFFVAPWKPDSFFFV